jgi:hypothetical protein
VLIRVAFYDNHPAMVPWASPLSQSSFALQTPLAPLPATLLVSSMLLTTPTTRHPAQTSVRGSMLPTHMIAIAKEHQMERKASKSTLQKSADSLSFMTIDLADYFDLDDDLKPKPDITLTLKHSDGSEETVTAHAALLACRFPPLLFHLSDSSSSRSSTFSADAPMASTLPGVNADAFKKVLRYLYSGSLPFDQPEEPSACSSALRSRSEVVWRRGRECGLQSDDGGRYRARDSDCQGTRESPCWSAKHQLPPLGPVSLEQAQR